jgi:hypothetical protein
MKQIEYKLKELKQQGNKDVDIEMVLTWFRDIKRRRRLQRARNYEIKKQTVKK